MILLTLHLACSTPVQPDVQPTDRLATEKSTAPRIVFLGDSLSAGMGISSDLAYPKIIEDKLNADGYPTEILNAGVSGDTTAGGLRRLDWILSQPANLIVVQLGANDGMRGVPVEDIGKNLRSIVETIKENQVDVMLMEMQLPPNYGEQYTTAFKDLYPKIAEEKNISLVPFLLKNVGGRADLNQGDGIHPNKEGHALMADEIYPTMQEWRVQFQAKAE